jgi:SAM-dependent methyltransferase
MQQTPVHDQHNPDLLSMLQPATPKICEVGCSSGALAREFKKISPQVHYTGIEIDPGYAELARKYCDRVYTLNIDDVPEYFWEIHSDISCWVFGDTLEHLKDPWKVLSKINKFIPKNGYVVACIPNMQHWSIQARLSVGDLRYQDSGLLDRTHLRWFTRQTIHEMFAQAGFEITEEKSRIFPESMSESVLALIENMANLFAYDKKIASQDAMPLQYVVKAVSNRN